MTRSAEGPRAPTPTRRARRWPAFVLVSGFVHGAVLASLSLIPVSRGGADAGAALEADAPDCVIQLRVQPLSLLATAEAEPLATPEPAAPEVEIAAAPEAAPAPALEPVATAWPEIEPEPSPEPPLPCVPPPAPAPPIATVVTTTAEEAPSVAHAAPLDPPKPQPEPVPPPAEVAPPAAAPAAPANPSAATGGSGPVGSSSAPASGGAPSAPANGAPTASGGTAPASGTPNLGALDDGFHLRALRSDRPEYPEDARRRNEEGSVTCRLTIDRDGRVVEVVVVISSGSDSLDRAAVRALKRWRFEPLAKITDRERVHAVQKLSFELHARRG